MASQTWFALVAVATLGCSVASPCKPIKFTSQSVVIITSSFSFDMGLASTTSIDTTIQTTRSTAFESLYTTATISKGNESTSTDSTSAESLSTVDTAVTEAVTPTIPTTISGGESFIVTTEVSITSTEASSLVVSETSSRTIGALTLSTEVLATTAETTIATNQATSAATTSDTIGLLTETTAAEPTTATTEATSKATTEDTTVTTTEATTQATSEASTGPTTIATTETTAGETTTRSTIEDTTEATTGTATETTAETTTGVTTTTTETISSTTESTTTTTSVEIPAKTNLIQNGGFEDSTNHWDYYGTNAHTFLTSNHHYEGTYSYAMGSTFGGEVGITQILDKSLLRPNTPYKLSIYATASSLIGCPGGIRIVVDTDRREETFGRYVSEFASAELAAGWRYISGDFTLTEDALMDDEPIKVIVNTLCAPGGNYVYIDNVELVG